jgi:hypothetical protein
LEIHIGNLSALAPEGVETRNYRKNPKDAQAQDLQLLRTADKSSIVFCINALASDDTPSL